MSARTTILLIALFALASCAAMSTNPPTTMPVLARTYTVCATSYAPDERPLHLALDVDDLVKVQQINLVTDVVFEQKGAPEQSKTISMVSIGDGQVLATVYEEEYAHPPARKHLITIVDETNQPTLPARCGTLESNQRVIRVRFCNPTSTDAAGGEAWACPGNRLPHNGDTHAKS